MTGEWLSVMGRLGTDTAWFWLGHSGYEYIDLGRLWQVVLLIGLFLWLGLVARAVWPALARRDEQRPILTLFVISAAAIASFYFAALGYGRHTNLAVAEYWRWRVVHLWVEGFFEVFATLVIAFLFARLGLVGMKSASRASILSATIFLSGGIIGTLHHLYFSGTPTFVLALGSVFSALEVVPLCFMGFEAWENLQLLHAGPQHDPGARSRRAVRRVRDVGQRLDAVLHASAAAARDMERSRALGRLLVAQHRPGGDGPAQPPARRLDPDLGFR
jgi:nitric oxide reductase subunit B